jgi:O-antigen ligase
VSTYALQLKARAISGRFRPLVIACACVTVGVVAGVSIARGEKLMLVPLLVVAGGAVVFSLRPESLFLGWFFLAPLLQNSADQSPLGHQLVTALYLAPSLGLLVWTFAERDPRLSPTFIDALPVAYLLCIIASFALTAADVRGPTGVSLRGIYKSVGIGIIGYYFLAFGPGRRITSTRFARTILNTGIVVAVMGILDGVVGWNLWNDTGWHSGIRRAVGTLANPAVFGAFVGMCLAVAFGILVWRGPPRLRREAWTMLAVGLPAVFLTFTRGPILATAVAVIVITASRSGTRLLAAGVSVVAAVVLIASWDHIQTTNVYQQRVVGVRAARNVEARVLLQDWSFKLAEARPLFGWGYNSFDRVKNAEGLSSGNIPVTFGLQNTSHNTWLTILVEYGGVGLLLIVIPWVMISWRSLKALILRPETRWFLTGALGALSVYVITASTADMRFFSFLPAVPWMLLGFLRRHQRVEGHGYTSP